MNNLITMVITTNQKVSREFRKRFEKQIIFKFKIKLKSQGSRTHLVGRGGQMFQIESTVCLRAVL